MNTQNHTTLRNSKSVANKYQILSHVVTNGEQKNYQSFYRTPALVAKGIINAHKGFLTNSNTGVVTVINLESGEVKHFVYLAGKLVSKGIHPVAPVEKKARARKTAATAEPTVSVVQ